MKDEDISFDVDELESQPIAPAIERLIENPSVDLAVSVAEKILGRECPKLREVAEECKKEVEGESKADRSARIRYKRQDLYGWKS